SWKYTWVNWPGTCALTEMVEYASTLPITCTSTGTFFCLADATVTGTSPPMPRRPPPLPEPPPPGAAEALAPEFEQPVSRNARRPINKRLQRILGDDGAPSHRWGVNLGIRRTQ